jgi:hypothetical protein
MLRGKFIAISVYIKKETSQVSIRQREIIKIRDEIKTIQTIQRINETKIWFFEKNQTKSTNL